MNVDLTLVRVTLLMSRDLVLYVSRLSSVSLWDFNVSNSVSSKNVSWGSCNISLYQNKYVTYSKLKRYSYEMHY